MEIPTKDFVHVCRFPAAACDMDLLAQVRRLAGIRAFRSVERLLPSQLPIEAASGREQVPQKRTGLRAFRLPLTVAGAAQVGAWPAIRIGPS